MLQRDARAEVREAVQGPRRRLEVGQHPVLRDLEAEVLGRDAVTGQQVGHVLRQRGVRQVGGGEVDGHREVHAVRAPAGELPERAVQHDPRHLRHEPGGN